MIYYKIADKIIEVKGERASDVERLPNFKPFMCEKSEEAFAIELTSKYNDFAVSELLYSLNSEGVDYSFAAIGNGGYGFKVDNTNNGSRLSLIYNGDSVVIGGDTDCYSIVFMMWVAYSLAFAKSGVIAVHSSAAVYNNKAVIFLGESGTGKSTHTRLWRENIEGATLLNDDSPIVRFAEGEVYVYGSPWSGKTHCYKNEHYQLAGIVRLSQAPANNIRKLNVLQSFGAFYPSCPPALAGSDYFSDIMCQTVSQILSCTPVWHLECLPNGEAAHLSFKTILGGR